MPPLPQELVDSIVGEVGDFDSLKACSLVMPLRYSSQRILLRSLTLKNPRSSLPNYAAVRDLFSQSPHVATYITRVKIELPRSNTNSADLESLYQVLRNLANVHRCILDGSGGVWGHLTAWPHLTPATVSAISDFLLCQPLQELHVDSIEKMSPSTFVRLITAAPLLGMRHVYSDANSVEISLESLLNEPSAPRLVLDTGSGDVAALLVRPDFSPLTAAIRGLSILEHHNGSGLVSSVAHRLERLHIKCTITPTLWQLSFPPLPALRSAEFAFRFAHSAAPELAAAILSILHHISSPALGEIIITYLNFAQQRLPELDPQFLAALDSALVVHPAGPQIRWRLDHRGDDRATYLDAFAYAVRREMPQVTELERLTFEAYHQSGFIDGLPYAVRI
ncbi:hypothetical protein FB451DRAFT_1247384 [Mycena latifolia]|nr:hypothetical protein FB451DRAFT_1247384 [Mycena latifolia]